MFPSRVVRKSIISRLLLSFIILTIAVPLPPAQAATLGEQARQSFGTAYSFINNSFYSLISGQDYTAQSYYKGDSDPSQNTNKVVKFELCPRRLTLYVGETFTLVPTPKGSDNEVLNGVVFDWQSNNNNIATVSSWGEVVGVAPGKTKVSVQAGSAKAHVLVEILEGVRRPQTDLEWDAEHANDCSNPGADPAEETISQQTSQPANQQITKVAENRSTNNASLKELIRPAVMTAPSSHQIVPASFKSVQPATVGKLPGRLYFQMAQGTIDGSQADVTSSSAANYNNAIGAPRFTPMETGRNTKTNLGSYNFSFAAPILSLPGRGIGVNLGLVYNSRVWTKDGSTMTFNFNKGWPAAGWSLGYGRIIKNYNNTLTGDGSGTGSANNPGDYMLVQPDGTRVPLKSSYDSTAGRYKHKTTDGTFIYFDLQSGKLSYPDGTVVQYNLTNNRYLPASIKTRNGDLVTISYRTYDAATFPYRWAINQIVDSLGRIINFHYYGDLPGTPEYYPYDNNAGKPQYALGKITCQDFNGEIRTLVELLYQQITFNYSFNTTNITTVNAPAKNSSLNVLRRIYYPATGRGYLFDAADYSCYGMLTKVSERIGMKGASGSVTDGTEIAYTKYNYPLTTTASGQISNAPKYDTRQEWWQGKTDASGNATSATTDYTYSRSTDGTALTQTDIVVYNGLKIEAVTNDDSSSPKFGTVTSRIYKNASTNAILRQIDYLYTMINLTEVQLGTVTNTEKGIAGKPDLVSKIDYTYSISYGRLSAEKVYGYLHNGNYPLLRQINYRYVDTANYINANLLRLVDRIEVLNGAGGTEAITGFIYDDYNAEGGMQTYTGYYTNHDSTYDQAKTVRGNITGEQPYVPGTPNWVVYTTRNCKYDIFGNVLLADDNSGNTKRATYSGATFYSLPDSVTQGGGGDYSTLQSPYLTTNFQYDFNVGLVSSKTSPDGLVTNYQYDPAWRLTKITPPSSDTTNTYISMGFDSDSYGNDQLSAYQRTSYKEADGSTIRTITNRSWFDGAGNVIRSGSGAGSSPSSYDSVKVVYDAIGRQLWQSNPYLGDSSGNISNGYYYTKNTYDLLSRVTQLDLVEFNNPVNTKLLQSISYGTDAPTGQSANVATVTATDPVGRKRTNEYNGIGQLASALEQDPATGSLTLRTKYSYDTLGNLTQSDQGGQLRSYAYDSLGRMTSETTPEAGTVSYTYNTSNTINTRTDARSVITTYGYDTMNRPTSISYTLPNPNPGGVVATPSVTINYNSSGVGIGQVSSIQIGSNGTGSESFTYDSYARPATRTQIIDGVNYQTQYTYNTANQLAKITYHSGNSILRKYDSRGRLNEIDKLDGTGTPTWPYMSNANYNPSGQLSGLNINNSLVTESYGYNEYLQLTSQQVVKNGSPSTTLLNLTYNYKPSGNSTDYTPVSSITNPYGPSTTVGNGGQLINVSGTITDNRSTPVSYNRNTTFSYDLLGRLVTADSSTWTGATTWQRKYQYDRWGNRTSVWNNTAGSGTAIQTLTMQPSGSATTNRINSSGYGYDASGNQISDPNGKTYQYDAEHRLVSVNSTAATYTYDASNRRIKKVVGASTTRYVWEGMQPIAEYSGTGSLITEYVYADDRLLAQEQPGGNISYYHPDRLSTRLVTDVSGNWKAMQDHLPFGETWGTYTEKHQFTNYERDSSTEGSNDYAINRQYANEVGRFMRPDPIRGSIGNPQSLNRYAYTLNDPINLTDPTGNIIFAPFLVAGAIGAGIGIGAALLNQWNRKPGEKFSWKAIVVAGAVGFGAGLALPTSLGGAIAVGAIANFSQYVLTEAWEGDPISGQTALFSLALGGLGGGIAGKFARSAQGPWAAASPNISSATRTLFKKANDEWAIRQNAAWGSLFRNGFAGLYTNVTPAPPESNASNASSKQSILNMPGAPARSGFISNPWIPDAGFWSGTFASLSDPSFIPQAVANSQGPDPINGLIEIRSNGTIIYYDVPNTADPYGGGK